MRDCFIVNDSILHNKTPPEAAPRPPAARASPCVGVSDSFQLNLLNFATHIKIVKSYECRGNYSDSSFVLSGKNSWQRRNTRAAN